jgi:hypothetical protein
MVGEGRKLEIADRKWRESEVMPSESTTAQGHHPSHVHVLLFFSDNDMYCASTVQFRIYFCFFCRHLIGRDFFRFDKDFAVIILAPSIPKKSA